jgi:hypothetical protein
MYGCRRYASCFCIVDLLTRGVYDVYVACCYVVLVGSSEYRGNIFN